MGRMADLVEWLRAALDAEEQGALEAQRRQTTSKRMIGRRVVEVPIQPNPLWRRSAWPPEKVLRTVQAHREILDRYETAIVSRDAAEGTALAGATRMSLRIRREAVLAIAAIYESRPGFDPSWIPEDPS